jgi:GNAT superfamily N-acetyltransferase
MDKVQQIKDICTETDNTWFLTHTFTQIALYDLTLKKKYEDENIFNFDERECECNLHKGCIYCDIEMERKDYIKKLELPNVIGVYDYDEEKYTKSKWIFADEIDGEIPGFILIQCTGLGCGSDEFTHNITFTCVRKKYRKQGILKKMLSKIPKEWKIWLEASNNEIEDIENIWKKCGFIYYTTIWDKHIIYCSSNL